MKTVTSLSGGRTSSYMAIHYPTDHNVFSLVRIEDERCSPKDKKLIQYVEDKIQKPFIATAESDLTLYVLIELEQELGRPITWVSGDTYEQICEYSRHKNSLPNRRMRYCTSELKLLPIFWHTFLNIMEDDEDIVKCNIGYRADEPRRSANGNYRYVVSQSIIPENINSIDRHRGKQKWAEIEFQETNFPLRKDGIDNLMIKSFWAKKPNYIFPIESNCVGCFNKTEATLQKQFLYEPDKMQWFKDMEAKTGQRFNIHRTLVDIETHDYTNGQQYMFENVTCNCTD